MPAARHEGTSQDPEACAAAGPWFTQRVRVAALAQDCALLVGALAKASRDISLMMQIEVGEAAGPAGPGRGGSSTMPHKRNPVGAALVLSAAARGTDAGGDNRCGAPSRA